MKKLKLLYHVHTNASYDSLNRVSRILGFCKKNNIELLAICDHDSIKNNNKANSIANKMGIKTIPSIEYSSSAGDIIGLFVKNKISSNNCVEILKSIKSQGGITVLPHPYKGHSLEKIPMDLVDLIEIFNPRCNKKDNELAVKLSKKLQKNTIVGADAHLHNELKLAINYFDYDGDSIKLNDNQIKKIILNNGRSFECKNTTYRNIKISQLIKSIKLKRPKLIFESIKGIIYSILINNQLK